MEKVDEKDPAVRQSALENKVKNTTGYSQLPNRLILNSPFNEKPKVSYGIIAYALNTGRFLLVRRLYSPEYIFLIRGSYRLSEIRRLLVGMSSEELNKIRDILKDPTLFEGIYRNTICSNIKDIAYPQLRFIESMATLKTEIQHVKGQTTTEYLFPKGRTFNNLEPVLSCAIREFEEEAGIRITTQILVSPKPVVESFRSINGHVYETRSWIFLFPKEIEPPVIPSDSGPGEIGHRSWMNEEQAFNVLRESRMKVLRIASKMIQSFMELDRGGI